MRFLLLATALLSTTVFAQGATVSDAIGVQRLAPQLVPFAGGEANFDNLVNGLASGNQVTLTTTLATGGTQVVTFTPSGTMSVEQIAQTLEGVRQSLIARGIATPSAQQIAAALTGGALTTPVGTTQVTGVVSTTTPANTSTVVSQQSPAVQMQNTIGQAAAGGSAPTGINASPSTMTAPSTPAPIAAPPTSAPLRAR